MSQVQDTAMAEQNTLFLTEEEMSSLADEGSPIEVLLASIPHDHEGRLEPKEVLGEGGMALIHAAQDRALRRRMAMKLLRPRFNDDDQAVFFFIREGQITAQLDHPNIVPVYDVGRGSNGLFISMKLIEGQTLDEVFDRYPTPPLPRETEFELLNIVQRVCDALSFAHAHGVLHGDIKPQNIMVGTHGQVYVMDWGLARPCPPVGDSADGPVIDLPDLPGIALPRLIGTPTYMAPEQASGRECDHRTDVFAVGGLLYRALSRQRPYYAGSISAVLKKARDRDLKPPSEVIGSNAIPEKLEAIVLKAMAANPAERYQTIDDLSRDLLGFQHAEMFQG
ncbi:MAG: serine/threonine-protein kinase [Acidobacteriota bacterium]